MKHRNLKHFGVVSVSAIVVCAFCYTGAAAFGYLTFGSNVNPDILMSYSADRPEVLIGILAMALKTVSTYPILLFCGREAVGSAITDLKALLSTAPSDSSSSSITTDRVSDIPEDQPQNGHFSSPVRIRIIIVVIWFLLSLMCAVVVPNIGEAIGLLGTLAAVFIFIIPGLCLANITFRSDPSLMRKFNIFLLVTGGVFIVIGTFLFGVVLTQDIQTMVKSPTSGLIRYYFHLNKLTCDMSS
jgi:sodium-coupled neutral amino acid transporter 7/8